MAQQNLRHYFDQQPAHKRIIFPLDVPTVAEAIRWVRLLKDHVGMFKVGFELQQCMLQSIINPEISASENARQVVLRKALEIFELFELLDGQVFWDGKFHDISNTVGGASKAVAGMDVAMFNVHCSGDIEPLQAAVANRGNAWVLGVTVLTSIKPEKCQYIYGAENIDQVLLFVRMLCGAGAHGVICSPLEVAEIRKNPDFNHLALVTPGVRPIWAGVGDQKRVMTPFEAILAGSDALVIGRPISESADPVQTCGLIAVDIKAALAER